MRPTLVEGSMPSARGFRATATYRRHVCALEHVIVGRKEEAAGARRSQIMSAGAGCIALQIASITGRVVKYWPAPRADSCAERASVVDRALRVHQQR